MIVRWYIGILILVFAVVGFNPPTDKNHNQEIVLNFNTAKTAEVEISSTIEKIKLQLNAAGITNIHVKSAVAGELKIKYYSQQTVESIKELLSENDAFSLNTSEQKSDNLPVENSGYNYNINVYEINKGSDSEQGLNGIVSEETNRESQRLSFNPDYFKIVFLEVEQHKNLSLSAKEVFDNDNVILTDYRIFKIPVVRAGPLA